MPEFMLNFFNDTFLYYYFWLLNNIHSIYTVFIQTESIITETQILKCLCLTKKIGHIQGHTLT